MAKRSLRRAGCDVVTSSSKTEEMTASAATPIQTLSKFQKMKLRVMAARRYKGRAFKVPQKVIDKFEADSGSAEMQKKLQAYLGLDYVPLRRAEKLKAQRERLADGAITEEEMAQLVRNPYDVKASAKLKRILFVPKDAETGEKLHLSEHIAPSRHTDNMIFRADVLSGIRELLQHPERPNKHTFVEGLKKYEAEPHNQLPQPRSVAGKLEKRGKVAASLQTLRQEHAKQIYDMVLEEEKRDEHRSKLMKWAVAKGDSAKMVKLNLRFARERERWRTFIAAVQEDNQMHLANQLAYYGLIR